MPQESFVKLRFKFVLPINLILVVILGASLAWEWWRLERNELGMLRTRLDEEARFRPRGRQDRRIQVCHSWAAWRP